MDQAQRRPQTPDLADGGITATGQVEARGYPMPLREAHVVSGRLRALIGEAPSQHWTAQTAGKALAVSEATLSRRLAGESVRVDFHPEVTH